MNNMVEISSIVNIYITFYFTKKLILFDLRFYVSS